MANQKKTCGTIQERPNPGVCCSNWQELPSWDTQLSSMSSGDYQWSLGRSSGCASINLEKKDKTSELKWYSDSDTIWKTVTCPNSDTLGECVFKK
jgi:hypothetical protein